MNFPSCIIYNLPCLSDIMLIFCELLCIISLLDKPFNLIILISVCNVCFICFVSFFMHLRYSLVLVFVDLTKPLDIH